MLFFSSLIFIYIECFEIQFPKSPDLANTLSGIIGKYDQDIRQFFYKMLFQKIIKSCSYVVGDVLELLTLYSLKNDALLILAGDSLKDALFGEKKRF